MSWWRKSRFRGKRRPFKLTRGGWVFILYTIGVGAGAINTGNNLLYLVFGIFLGLIMASGALSDASLWGLTAEWSFPNAGEATRPAYIPLRVINQKKWFPSLSVSVEMEGELAGEKIVIRTFVPWVGAGESVARQIAFFPPQRGWFHLKSLKFYTTYPFGLLRKVWTLCDDTEAGMFVYPALFNLAFEDVDRKNRGPEPLLSSHEKGEGAAMYSIREFRPSDNPRHIHWKATAKRGFAETAVPGPWLVREMEKDASEETLFSWPSLEEFVAMERAQAEELIRYTASVLWLYGQRGPGAELVIPGPEGLLTLRPDDDLSAGSLAGRSSLQSTLEYLSLFNPREPRHPSTAAYLTPAPHVIKERFPAGVVEVYPAYQAWIKAGSHGK